MDNMPETIKQIINIVSYGLTLLAFAAVLLLIYIAVYEVFIGKNKLLKLKETSGDGGKPAWLLPVCTAGALWILYLIITAIRNTTGNAVSIFNVPTAGLLTKFPDMIVTNKASGWIIALVSIVFYIATSMMIEKESDKNTSLLFCLSPVAFFMVLPNTIGILAFVIVTAYYAAKQKNFPILAIMIVAFIVLHIPFKSTGPLPVVSVEEVVMIAYLAFLWIASKYLKKYYDAIEIIAGIASGVATAYYVLNL